MLPVDEVEQWTQPMTVLPKALSSDTAQKSAHKWRQKQKRINIGQD